MPQVKREVDLRRMTNKMTNAELQARIDKHEEICSIRWAEILGKSKAIGNNNPGICRNNDSYVN